MIVFSRGCETHVAPDNTLTKPFKANIWDYSRQFSTFPTLSLHTQDRRNDLKHLILPGWNGYGNRESWAPGFLSGWFRSNQTLLHCYGNRLKPVKLKSGEIRTALPHLEQPQKQAQTLLRDLFAADRLVISPAPDERYEKNVDLLGISARRLGPAYTCGLEHQAEAFAGWELYFRCIIGLLAFMASFTGGVLVHYHICEGYVCAQGFLHTTGGILTGVGLSCGNQILLLSVDSKAVQTNTISQRFSTLGSPELQVVNCIWHILFLFLWAWLEIID